MRNVPVHVVVLERLLEKVTSRLEAHRVKTGDGLQHDDYQRHVGRIAEGKVLAKEIQDLQKQLRNDEDLEDTDDKPRKRRS